MSLGLPTGLNDDSLQLEEPLEEGLCGFVARWCFWNSGFFLVFVVIRKRLSSVSAISGLGN